jgi:tetratricopeptide (TPR) repeat protein
MKQSIMGAMCALALSATSPEAFAQGPGGTYGGNSNPVQAVSTIAYEAQIDPLDEHIRYIQREWARIKYHVPDEDSKLNEIHQLESHAAKVNTAYPRRAESMIWEAIILSTDAGIVKGMSALGKVRKAKSLLEGALQINPKALDGSAYTSLGSLYYQVPGWPIAFGDDDEAEKNLKMAISINPHGIDPNFFYGDFLLQDERYEEAQVYLERALQAPERPDRPLADSGRRQEIKAALAKVQENMKDKYRKTFND